MPTPAPTPHRVSPDPTQGRGRLAIALATAALGLNGYLASAALIGDGLPAGCGPATGCHAVLTSAWSQVAGMPVALPAAGLYASVLVYLLLRQLTGGLFLAIAAGTMLGAAGWFTAVQTVHLGTPCRYCLASHALAVALAGVLLRDTRPPVAASGMALGMLATAGLALLQLLRP